MTADTVITPVPVRTHPLSFEQERLWFLERLHPGRVTLNAPIAVRLRGTLDIPALAAAINEVVLRHEALRSVLDRDEPRAHVFERFDLPLPVLDVSAESWEEALDTEVRRPFDLTAGPLIRTTLLRRGPLDHVLVVVVHHIVVDRWSLGLLLGELAERYRPAHLRSLAGGSGAAHTTSDPAVPYAEYVSWQRSQLTDALRAEQLEYWRTALAGARPLELPADRVRLGAPRQRAGLVQVMLEPEIEEAVRRFARTARATPFMVHLAAINAVLGRWTGETDLCLGTPVAARGQERFQSTIGMFLNNLTLRTDLSGAPAFTEAVARTKSAVLGALDRQELPFALVVEDLAPVRDPGATPLFRIAVNMTNVAGLEPRLEGLECELLPPPAPGANYDLTLYLDPVAAGTELAAVYDADLFDAATIDELLEQIRGFLVAALREPDAPVTRQSLLTPRAAKVLPDPTAVLDASWAGAIPDMLAARAAERPQAAAVQSAAGLLDYATLEARSTELAARLVGEGVRRGDVVALHLDRGADLVVAILAVQRAGAAMALLDPGQPLPRRARQLALARPRCWLDRAGAAPARELVEAAGREPLARTAAAPDAADAANVAVFPASGPDDIAYLAFTSGSSGEPKGVLGRHGPLTHFLPWYRSEFGMGPDDRFSMLSGIGHDPLHREVFTPVYLGARICIPAAEDFGHAGRLAAWLAAQEVSVAHLSPAMASYIVRGADGAPPNRHLRLAFFTGEPLRRNQYEEFRAMFPQAACINSYGTTETSRAVAISRLEQVDPGWRAAPVGKGIPDVQLLVLAGHGGMAGVGELGELCLRSPHLSAGYAPGADAPDERQPFAANPFSEQPHDRIYRTGDLGRYAADGTARLVGRADRQIQIRGYRVEPREVERCLEEHPGVRTAAVVVRQGRVAEAEVELAAYVEVAGPERPTTAELRAQLWRALPECLVPASIRVLDRLPVTPNGKLDRERLRTAPDETSEDDPRTLPRTPLERIIADLWSELLAIPAVYVEDDFFRLGGHSLLAIRFLAVLREACGVDLPVAEIFTERTVSALAVAVLRRLQAAANTQEGPGR